MSSSSSKPSTSKLKMQHTGSSTGATLSAPGKRGSGQVFRFSKSAEAKRLQGQSGAGQKPPSSLRADAHTREGKGDAKAKGANAAVRAKVAAASKSANRQRRSRLSKFDSDSENDDARDSASDDDGSDELASDDEEQRTTAAATEASQGKSTKTSKRKRRAVSPETFGQTLLGLIGQSAQAGQDTIDEHKAESGNDKDEQDQPSKKARTSASSGAGPMLSLAPQLRRAVASSRLSAKAARVMLQARKERQERARVKDVISGWGAPGLPPGVTPDLNSQKEMAEAWIKDGGAAGRERKLRKVAQRGVVKLFNAIRAAQSTSVEDLSRSVQPRGVAPSPSPSVSEVQERRNSGKRHQGREPEQWQSKGQQVAQLSKNNFLDLIRAGKTSKA
ncbi:hypothetical protein CBOM_05795 [Ceraceosorus bombacis]|uniref:Rrp15p-domain-containing protein n=1 Tax=Ceraceosorus bombacis TaxID=401625 RepID=A0A0N7LBE0_9BASI|nr:hypothetical protein CBOM_05795 [Ceraceosorus bombacis]